MFSCWQIRTVICPCWSEPRFSEFHSSTGTFPPYLFKSLLWCARFFSLWFYQVQPVYFHCCVSVQTACVFSVIPGSPKPTLTPLNSCLLGGQVRIKTTFNRVVMRMKSPNKWETDWLTGDSQWKSDWKGQREAGFKLGVKNAECLQRGSGKVKTFPVYRKIESCLFSMSSPSLRPLGRYFFSVGDCIFKSALGWM
jgi:hypothetical protein